MKNKRVPTREKVTLLPQKLILFCICFMFMMVNCGKSDAVTKVETGIPYSLELMTRYMDLNEKQKEIFSEVYEGIRRNDDTIVLPRNTRYEDAKVVMSCIMQDCPELCNLSNRYTIDYYRNGPDEATAIHPEYENTQEAVSILIQRAWNICMNVEGDTLAREEQLYDLLIENCSYSYEQTPNANTAYGAILEGKATCEGYARAYMLFLRLSGIRCGIVTGYAENGTGGGAHTWNIINIDKYTLFCDPTWDDPNESMKNMHFYFNVPELPDHHPCETVDLISMTYDMTWHAMHGTMIDPTKERENTIQLIIERIDDDGSANIRFAAEENYRDIKDNFQMIMTEICTRVHYKRPISYKYFFNDEQRCVWIQMGSGDE